VDDDDGDIVVDLMEGARFKAHGRMGERTASDDIQKTSKRYRAGLGVDELPAWLRELANSTDVVGHDGRGPRIEHRLKRAQSGSWGVERNHTFCFHSNGRMNDHRCASRSIAPDSRKPYG